MLYTILIGLVAGIVAKFLTPGRDPGGWIITILLGIAGSYVGTFLGRSIGHYQDGQTAGFIASVIGAIVLLLIYRLFTKGKTAVERKGAKGTTETVVRRGRREGIPFPATACHFSVTSEAPRSRSPCSSVAVAAIANPLPLHRRTAPGAVHRQQPHPRQ